jgi:hypothetical protein
MKRRHYVSIISFVVAAGLLGAGALVVGQSHVPAQIIASSVTRTPELLERAWRLPVAATFQRKVSWQSNGSRCGLPPLPMRIGLLGTQLARRERC